MRQKYLGNKNVSNNVRKPKELLNKIRKVNDGQRVLLEDLGFPITPHHIALLLKYRGIFVT